MREKRKTGAGKVICSPSPRGQTERHLRGLIRLSLQYPSLILWWSITSLSILHLWLSLSLSLQHMHTHTLHISIFWVYLCFPLSSPSSLFLTTFFFFFFGPSTSSFHFLFCLATFEVCHSSCFVGPYSLISTSAFVTLVQFHFQVVTVGRLEFGTVKVTMVLCEDA